MTKESHINYGEDQKYTDQRFYSTDPRSYATVVQHRLCADQPLVPQTAATLPTVHYISEDAR